jgi:hypothetical protein
LNIVDRVKTITFSSPSGNAANHMRIQHWHNSLCFARPAFKWASLALFMLVLGCSPHHVNPLDPASPNYIPPDAGPAPASIVARVRSVHTASGTNFHVYSVSAETWSTGQEVIDSAWVSYCGGPLFSMEAGAGNIWAAYLSDATFEDPHLGSVVGQPFTFLIHTSADSSYRCGPVYLFRVIEDTIRIVSPNGGQTGPHPTLTWRAFSASYPFDYTVNVFKIVMPPLVVPLVWSAAHVSADSNRVTVSDSLTPGHYFWTVAVVDHYDDWSCSSEGSFEIPEGGTP